MTGYSLTLLTGPKQGLEIVLKAGLLCVGRGKEGQRKYGWLLLSDPTVSRHHANIHWLPAERQFLLEHLSQTNPTLVNGAEVRGTRLLAHGSRIRIGMSEFVLERKKIAIPPVAMPLNPATKAVDITSEEPLDSMPDFCLQLLPDGFKEVLTRERPHVIGIGVKVTWQPSERCFVLTGAPQTTSTVSRYQDGTERVLAASQGVKLQHGDLLTVDFCHFRFAQELDVEEPGQTLREEAGEDLKRFQIPGHRVLSRLGAGASGEVIHMQNCQGRSVAVKFLRSQLMLDEAARKRFQREITVAMGLRHPGLLRVLEAGQTPQGQPYFVSEFLQGKTLGSRIAEGPLNLGEAVKIGRQLADALDFLHAQGLVHRDVKPDNIFLTEQGAVLMDFGIVRGADLTTATQTGFAMGTPYYMAPEQFRGHPGSSSDQYALGAVIFEALTGRRVFEGTDAMALAYLHVHQTPPDLTDLLPDCPPVAAAVISKMLAKMPNARFPRNREAMEQLASTL